MVVLDGLYAIAKFMQSLINKGISFEMRMHSNRVVTYKGKRCQLKKLPTLALKKGRKTRSAYACWQNMKLHFTSVKRQNKSGDFTIVYQVSNTKMLSKDHVKIYSYRWNIEKFFRTAKQHLGLNDCQSRKLQKQNGHIFNVFFAYAIAQYERVRKKLKNVETAIKSIKAYFSGKTKQAISRFREIFCYA